MHILLVNDDGIEAEGIYELIRALSAMHQITVAAPAKQQSAMSHAITVGKDIIVEHDKRLEAEFNITAWKINGTPADCVKLYLEAIQPKEKWPDLVISGINYGANLGTDVIYSGTVGAAVEGFQHNVASIAVSLDYNSVISFAEAADNLTCLLKKIFTLFQTPFLLNINYPEKYAEDDIGPVLTKTGNRDYENAFHSEACGDKIVYRMAGDIIDYGNDEETDIYQTKKGKISITPLSIDMTDKTMLNNKRNDFVLLAKQS